jgi:hypothetical protein
MTKTKLWTLIIFFWLGRFAPAPDFVKSLRYMKRSFIEILLLFGAAEKKKNLRTGPTRKRKFKACWEGFVTTGSKGCERCINWDTTITDGRREGR